MIPCCHSRPPFLLLLPVVALIPVGLPAAEREWDGQGVFERWESAINWEGNVAPNPGDDLIWPKPFTLVGGTGTSTINNFDSGTVFRSLEMVSINELASRGWEHDGNRIHLRGDDSRPDIRTSGKEGLINSTDFIVQGARTRIKLPITLVSRSPNTTGHVFENNRGSTEFTGGISMGTERLTLRGLGYSPSGNYPVNGVIIIDCSISGSGLLTLEGDGLLRRANSLTGEILCAGQWDVYDEGALGSTATGTRITGQLTYHPATLSEPIELQGTQSGLYLPAPEGVTLTLPLHISAEQASLSFGGNTLLDQPIHGEGAPQTHGDLFLDVAPGTTLSLIGSAQNTWAGSVTLRSGTMNLNRAAGVSWLGDVMASDDLHGEEGTIRWTRLHQVGDTAVLASENGGLIDLDGFTDSVKELKLMGGYARTGTGVLGVSQALRASGKVDEFSLEYFGDLDPEFTGNLRLEGTVQCEWAISIAPLTFDANVSVAPGANSTARKTGNGSLLWNGNSTGLTLLDHRAGLVDYHGTSPGLDLQLNSLSAATPARFLGRQCELRDLRTAPASLACELEFTGGTSQVRSISLGPVCTLHRELSAVSASAFPAVSGNVVLGDAALSVALDAALPVVINQEFLVIRKDSAGPVSGTLRRATDGSALREGHLFAPGGGRIYRFSYAGGDGNDVSLKLVSVNPTGSTRTWTGGAAGNDWNEATNWNALTPAAPPRPGDLLHFPAVADRAPVNDFLSGTIFHQMRFLADAYTVSGNRVALNNGIDLNFASGQTTIQQAVTLAGDQHFTARSSTRLRMATTAAGVTNLNGHTLVLDPQTAAAAIEFGAPAAGSDPPAAITGSGFLLKTGAGTTILHAPSNFSGPFTIGQGTVRLARSPAALGASGSSAILTGEGVLELAMPGGTVPNPVHLQSGKLRGDAGTGFTAGVTSLSLQSAGERVEVLSGSLAIAGAVSGAGGILKTGAGALVLNGAAPLTFAGPLHVSGGSARLEKPANSNGIPSLQITGATVTLNAPEQIAGSALVQAASVLNLNGHSETLTQLTLADSTVQTGAGTLTANSISTTGPAGSVLSGKFAVSAGGVVFNVPNDDALHDLTVSAAVSGAALTKNGDGHVLLSGSNTFSAALINGGALIFAGTNTAPVTLEGGMTGGTGTIGLLTSGAGGGYVSPGLSTGIFNCGVVSWNAATTFVVELQNSTPGTGHDQLNVTGGVTLGGASLHVFPAAGALAGTFVIINNDAADAVTGTFAGLAQDAVFSAAGKTFRISYTGGTGNDVTLTPVVSGTGVTKIWSGGGANNKWSTAANWSGGVAPVAGDDLSFPDIAAQKTNLNDFANGTTFNSILFHGGGYLISPDTGAHGVQLNAGVHFHHTGTSTLALDLTLTGPQTFSQTLSSTANISPPASLNTGGFALTLDVTNANALLSTEKITGGGSLTKTGAGRCALGASTFTGGVTLSGGETRVLALAAFGSGTSAVAVQSGAEVRFEDFPAGTFTRALSLAGKLEFFNSPVTLSGAITLATGAQRVVETAGTGIPILSGVLGNAGGLRKTGPGSLTLSGAGANTFSGGCTVAEGTLRLQKSSQVALPGPVTIGDGTGTDVLTHLAANQIANGATVNLNGSGAQMQCGTFSDTIGVLRFTGGSVTGSGTLTVLERLESFAAATTATVDVNLEPMVSPFSIMVDDGAATTDLAIASDWLGAVTLDAGRTGAGTFALRSGAMRTLTLHEGTTLVTGRFDAAGIVLGGGTLGGNGITSAVTTVAGKTGIIAPGMSPGELTLTDWSGDEATTLAIELGGLTPGTQHDVLHVTGTADPRDAALELSVTQGFGLTPGQSFTILRYDGPGGIPSTFRGLTEGTLFNFAGATASLSYRGGDGNDAMLTILSVNDTGVTRWWDGGGANNQWTTPQNWEDDIAPAAGDTLIFPDAVPQLNSTNDFPAGTNFHRIVIAGSGVTLAGNAIALNAGVSSTHSASAGFGLPVTLTGPQTFSTDGQGDLSVTSAATVNLNGHTLTCDIRSTGDLLMQNSLTGSGGVRCDSIGTADGADFGRVHFTGVSSYNGAFTLVQGGVHVAHPSALGTSASVSATGAIFVNAAANPVFPQPVTLRGALVAEGGTARFNGLIALPTAAQGVIAGDTTILAGRIQGAGSLHVRLTPGHSLTLTGALANTFTGGLTAFSGEVVLQKAAGLTSLPGPVVIHDTVRLAAANQIADTTTVTLHEGALLDLAGFSDTLAGLTLTGAAVTTGAGTLTLTGGVSTLSAATITTLSGILAHTGAGIHHWSVADGSAAPDLQCDAVVNAATGVIVRKTGAGSATFTGACVMSDIQIADGQVNWNGIAPGTFLTLDGGTLAGTGTFDQLMSAAGGGILTPGASPGILGGNNFHFNAATTLRLEINGPAAGTQYDQITIEDESSLANAVLDFQPGYTPAIGDSFTIIDSAGTGVLDTFGGLPEGTHFIRGAHVFRINYHAGGGGDVVITTVDPPAPNITSFNLAPGTGDEAGLTVIDVTATGAHGLTYVLEASRELENWTVLQTVTAGAGGLTFRATEPDTNPRCFYRARQQ